jgi:hypothetical protein
MQLFFSEKLFFCSNEFEFFLTLFGASNNADQKSKTDMDSAIAIKTFLFSTL